MNALQRWWFAPAPALRLGLVRVAIGIYCVLLLAIRGTGYADVGDLEPAQFEPVGIARVLSQPLPPSVVTALVVLAGVLGVAFTLGWRFQITGPAFALAFLWVATYRNAWGHVGHGDHLVALHVLVIAFAPAADAAAIDPPQRREGWRYGWPLRLMAAITVLTYALAGIAKLKFGADAWLGGDAVRLQIAYDAVRKARFGVQPSSLAIALLPHAWAFAPLTLATLAIELGAPLALLSRRLTHAWIAAAWVMHLGIALLMFLAFAYPLSLVAFAPLLRPERIVARLRRRVRRRRAR